MDPEKLRELFERADVHYEILKHPAAYTAQEEAAAAHVPGHMFCKTVVAFADGRPVLLVLPAPHLVDFEKVRAHLGAQDVRLATESEMAGLFPDSDVGAMPPLAPGRDIAVYMDEELARNENIAFEAGLHDHAVLMPLADYRRIASPVVFSFGMERASGAASREAIAQRAYELYAARGYEHGHDLDDWLQAEAELRGTSGVA